MPSPTALLERTDRAVPTSGGREMPAYRAPRPGDLIAIRCTDPRYDEVQVRITTVADSRDYLVITGAWKGTDLEVIVHRVGDTKPLT